MSMTNTDIPMGFGMALSQNIASMEYFSALSEEQKQKVISAVHQIHSKQEMHHFVQNLPNQTF